jgi:streptogrisin C
VKRLRITGACVLGAVVLGAALASALSAKSGLYGLSSPSLADASTPGSSGSLFALETAALTSQGISPAHAYQAIGVQSEIAQSGLASEIESAMSDTYGGMWFEPSTAQLHVGVTSAAGRRTVEAMAARAGLTADVTVTEVRSTWAQLLAVRAQWNRRLADLFPLHEAATGLAPQSNALVVTLTSSVPEAERALLEHEATMETNASVSLAVMSSSQLRLLHDGTKTECNKFETGKAYCNKTLTSGVSIREDAPGNCTAGPLAISKTNKSTTYLLTAGHCLTNPGGIGSKWYAYNRAGESKEIGPTTEFFNETKADVGAIKVNNPGYWVESTKNPVFADTVEWGTKNPETSYFVAGERRPIVGNTNCHEGQTTGQSCGTITKIDLTTGGAEEFVEDTGAVSEPGDSGGPWLFITTKDNEALMEGVHDGRFRGNTYWEPLSGAYRVLTKLNLELLTTANEVRP